MSTAARSTETNFFSVGGGARPGAKPEEGRKCPAPTLHTVHSPDLQGEGVWSIHPVCGFTQLCSVKPGGKAKTWRF